MMCVSHNSDPIWHPCLGVAYALSMCVQARVPEPLLLVEQARCESHQEVWVCGQGAQGHAAAQARDPDQDPAAAHQGAVRRRAQPSSQVRHALQAHHAASVLLLKREILTKILVWRTKV